MRFDTFEEVKRLTEEMVAIPSINKSEGGETAAAQYVYDYYAGLPYFAERPAQLKFVQTKDDFVERYNTIAWVKGTKGESKRTVILMGHVDTVGVDDYGTIRDYAFNTKELPEKLRETFDLPQAVLDDMDSGEYMFGRGTLDMKAGVAGHMVIMKYFSEHPEELDGNLLHLAECDEEDGSKGVMAALDELIALKESEGFEYTACINADYSTSEGAQDRRRYVYFGTIGKLLPCFAVFGRAAHVGQAFSAFDPDLLIAEITKRMSYNTDLCDEALGEVTLPPVALKMTDTKPSYDVQTALSGLVYFNVFSHGRGPDEIMRRCKAIAEDSFSEIVRYLNSQWARYCGKSGRPYSPLPWNTKVYSWKEYYDLIAYEKGDAFRDAIRAFTEKLHADEPSLDLRLFSFRVIEEARKWADDKSPAVIIYFGSAYNARIEMGRGTPEEQALSDAVQAAVEKVDPESERELLTRMFYPYISDLSFLAVCDTDEQIAAVGGNMPAWGVKYLYDAEKIRQIDVPVVNIGTFGYAGHELTERVDMKHSFENVPNITFETLLRLLG